MQSASSCHMCGRCAGFKDAVALKTRPSSHEIVAVAGEEAKPWETALIVFGLLGVAPGAFLWSASPLFLVAKQKAAEWLIGHGALWPLEPRLPWWILTNYPANNDVLTPLDGVLMIGYIAATAAAMGVGILTCLALSARATGKFEAARLHHFAQSLIPIAACGVFLGLSATTLTQLRADGVSLALVPSLRAALLVGASLWSLRLAWSISGRYARPHAARLAATLGVAGAVALSAMNWILMFWIW